MYDGLITFTLIGLILPPASGGAQGVGDVSGGVIRSLNSPPSLQPPADVRIGQTVWVTTSDGHEKKGTISSVSSSVIELHVEGGRLSYALRDVLRIETRDSAADGARRGSIVGGIGAGVYLGLLAYGLRCRSNCGPDYSVARDVAKGATVFGAIGAGLGALAGGLIDRLIEGRRLVYGSSARTVTAVVTPVASPSAAGVNITIRWP